MKKLLVVLVLQTFCLTACLQTENSSEDDGPELVDDGSNPNFTAARAVISAQCDTCHDSHGFNSNTPEEDFVSSSRIIKGAANDTSYLFCRVTEGSGCGSVMPQSGRMDEASIEVLRTWITNMQ